MLRRQQPYLINDYLWPAVLLSGLIHAALFWWLLPSWAPVRHQNTPTLTTVINYRTPDAPELAQRLAQWDAQGGGTEATPELSSSPYQGTGPIGINDFFLQALLREQQKREAEQQALLERLQAQAPTVAPPQQQNHQDPIWAEAANGQDQFNLVQQRLAALEQDIERYNQRPRYFFAGPSTQASPFAAYVEAWQAKVERIGTEHYPHQARGQSSAQLQLTIYIHQNGEISHIEFDRPAKNPLFNLAAQRVVQLAAPFAPFSPEMAQEADILAITRTWHFEQGRLRTQAQETAQPQQAARPDERLAKSNSATPTTP